MFHTNSWNTSREFFKCLKNGECPRHCQLDVMDGPLVTPGFEAAGLEGTSPGTSWGLEC